MNPLEDMIKAIRDWTKGRISEFEKNLNVNTLLRKTGDASKVKSTFSKYGSRVLPASGETLDVTLGKILKYLSDLGAAAYSNTTPTRDYDSLNNKPMRSSFLIYHESTTVAKIEEILNLNKDNALIVYGVGGASSSSIPKNKVDFFRAYLLAFDKDYESDNNGSQIYKAKMIQLGNLGSTARWSLYPSGYAQMGVSIGAHVSVNIPKGSWANVQGLRIPLYTQYANNK